MLTFLFRFFLSRKGRNLEKARKQLDVRVQEGGKTADSLREHVRSLEGQLQKQVFSVRVGIQIAMFLQEAAKGSNTCKYLVCVCLFDAEVFNLSRHLGIQSAMHSIMVLKGSLTSWCLLFFPLKSLWCIAKLGFEEQLSEFI